MSNCIDPITTAYVVKGAVTHPHFADNTSLLWVGEVEVMDFIVKQADVLEQTYQASDLDFGHLVFAYEVAESFGHRLVECIGQTGRFPDEEQINLAIQKLFEETGVPPELPTFRITTP